MSKILKAILPFIFLTVLIACNLPSDFLESQKRHERVRESIEEKKDYLENNLQQHALQLDSFHLLFVAYKDYNELEVYAKSLRKDSFIKVNTYEICEGSGFLGPKVREGDFQIPEGFYHIDRFNPNSGFYLSLGLNYPNKADSIRSGYENPGSDIFIHGDCVSTGCLPMTDDYIKELYVLAVYACNNGQKQIPVYIFPYAMSDKNFDFYVEQFQADSTLIDFWGNLKMGYQKFFAEKKALAFSVSDNGEYFF